jgi:MraZ protein
MGNYLKSLDQKGRVKLPPIFKETLTADGSTVVLTRNLDGSINLYPQDEYRKLANYLSSLPKGSQANRILVRLLIAESFECSIDAQSRVNIPTNLQRAAGLLDTPQAIIAGVGNFIQIWQPDRYEKSLESLDLDSIGDDLDIQL